MELQNYLQVGISLFGLLSGTFAYVIGLRIKHDILENNLSVEKELLDEKEKRNAAITGVRDVILRELGTHLSQMEDKINRTERLANETSLTLTEKILTVVNSKYVRTDYHLQAMSNIQERFIAMKELIEISIEKLEQSIDNKS